MISSVNKSLEAVRKLSFFAKFSEDEIAEILRYAVVSKFKKSQKLFFTEEKIHNFSIVLNGILKLAVTNEKGDESVLFIAESGDFLNNIFDDDFQTDAVAISDGEMLLIPLKQAREMLRNIPNFGFIILQETAKRNQILLSQIKQLRLSDSKQKVGKFLLENAFNEVSDKSEKIELKCEKSLIASYLGIKSETLSRVLQKLINDGEILVDKNKITLVKSESLCQYCSSEIASKCSKNKSDFCLQS